MRERDDGMLFLVPLFCFMSVFPLEKDMFVSLVSPVGGVFLFSCSQNCLHFCTRIIALTCGSRFQGCAARIKSSSPCHPCLHLHKSVPHSHLLPRYLHQEQPLRSRCRSTNTALLRQKEESGPLAKTTSSTRCTRSSSLRDCASARRHSCRPVMRQTLRRALLYL